MCHRVSGGVDVPAHFPRCAMGRLRSLLADELHPVGGALGSWPPREGGAAGPRAGVGETGLGGGGVVVLHHSGQVLGAASAFRGRIAD